MNLIAWSFWTFSKSNVSLISNNFQISKFIGHYEKAGITPQECLIDENLGNKAVSSEEKYFIKILEKINLDPQNLVALFG